MHPALYCGDGFGGSKPPPYGERERAAIIRPEGRGGANHASPFGRGGARSVTERVCLPPGGRWHGGAVTEGAGDRGVGDFVAFSAVLSPSRDPRGSPLSEGAKDKRDGEGDAFPGGSQGAASRCRAGACSRRFVVATQKVRVWLERFIVRDLTAFRRFDIRLFRREQAPALRQRSDTVGASPPALRHEGKRYEASR